MKVSYYTTMTMLSLATLGIFATCLPRAALRRVVFPTITFLTVSYLLLRYATPYMSC
jgi:hypothetical protein